MAWQRISSEVTVKGPIQWMGLTIRCGMTVKRMGKLGASAWKVKALTVKTETVTLFGKTR
jgi:hypothetical protein